MDKKTDQKTRESIIEASMELFARRGYHGTSVAQIAEATGLTKGALYWHFKDKEDLFLTVLERIKEHWRQNVLSRVEAADGVFDKLDRLFDATSEMLASRENPYSMHLFLTAAGAQPEMAEFEDAIKSAYAEYVKLVADTIRSGQEEGDIIRDIDAESAALGIIGCLEGMILQARLHSPAAVAAAITEMKRQFVHSLNAAPTRRSKTKAKRASVGADQMNLF